ncbi:MAG: B12-binding domain-containing radical SAM protein [Candidatus Omnitrophica bacterium]|nr:B12-binding domain-containing radical SAM protein [Candidatus Omnitrophota bacterium]
MKIGLLAMSGIRACDEELLRLGLTLPGFVERSKTIASLPSLGLLTLAGMTPKEHKIEYIEIPNLKEIDEIPNGFDLVAISSYSAQIDEAYELGARYKEKGIPVVIGGPHVSCLPEEAIKYCDSVIIGEGELVWNQVLKDCEKGELKQNYGSLTGSFDLADAPMPAFELLDISKYNRLTVQTSRGCPHKCEFCASSVILTSKYKQKPIYKVIKEIDKILDIWKYPFIEFADDNSIVDKAYWKELLVKLKDKNIKWFTETDLSVSEDEELLDLMRESGCAQVLIGFESPVLTGLKGLETRSDWKFKRLSKYKDAIKIIQSHGITVNGCFVIGLDGHGPEIFDQIFDFVKESGLYEVQITIMTAFPGTPLYARLKKENRIIEDKEWRKCTLFDLNFKPNNMTADELTSGFRNLGVKLYSKEFTAWRRDNFKNNLRNNIREKRRVKNGDS